MNKIMYFYMYRHIVYNTKVFVCFLLLNFLNVNSKRNNAQNKKTSKILNCHKISKRAVE